MGAPTGAIRAGRSYVEMFADPSALIRTLEQVKKRVLGFGKEVGRIGLAATAAGASVLTPIVKMFTAAVEEGADVGKLAAKYGSTAEQISTLRGAFAQAGVGAGEFSGAMEKLADKISHAADANEPLLESLRSLGTGRDFMGKGIDEQFDMIAERIKAIPNDIDKIRAANELGMGSMLEVLKKGKAGLDEYRAAAVANGDVMSGEQTKQAMEIQREYNRVMLAGRSALLEIGKALLPTGASFTSIGKDIRDTLTDVRAWIQSNREIIVKVTAAAAALVVGGLAVAAFGGAVAVAAKVIAVAVIPLKLLAGTITLLGNPFVQAALAIAVFTAGLVYLYSLTEKGSGVFGELKAAATGFVENLKSAWQGIGDALSLGNFTLAFQIGTKTAELAWAHMINNLTIAWVGFKDHFVDTGKTAWEAIAGAFIDVATLIAKHFTFILHGLIDGYNSTIGQISGKIDVEGIINTPAQVQAKADELKKDLADERLRSQREAEKFRQTQLDAGNAGVNIAKAELGKLTRQAATEAAENAARQAGTLIGGFLFGGKKGAPSTTLPSFAALSESAKGTFGSSSIQQTLGYGDNIGQRQLDAQLGIKDNTAATAKGVLALLEKPGAIFT